MEPTEGTWELVPGESGFMGNLEEPPTEPHPPTIMAITPDNREVLLATLHEPIPEGSPIDAITGDPEQLGDAHANGYYMARATDMFDALAELVAFLEADVTVRCYRHSVSPSTHNAMGRAHQLLSELASQTGRNRPRDRYRSIRDLRRS